MFLTKDSKSPYYQLVYFVNGKRTKISTRTINKKEAEKFLYTFNPNNKIKEKTNNESEGERSVSIPLTDFIEEYKTYISNTYSVAYLKRAVTPAFNKFQNFIPDVSLEMITSRNIDQFISSITSYSRSAASLYYRTLKASFNKAVAWNYIKENPFNKIKAPKVTKTFPVFINLEELQKIIDKTEKQFLKNLFYTAFYTGMRLGELVNMKWNWIDFEKNIITVKCSDNFTTKSKRERVIPINSALKNILLKSQPKLMNINKDNFVFTRVRNLKLNEDYVSKQFKKAVRAAKLNDNIHLHSLRHSTASNLVQKGISLYVIKEILGHSNITTTQIYSHLQPENLYKAINLL